MQIKKNLNQELRINISEVCKEISTNQLFWTFS